MKAAIHPTYNKEAKISCACGAEFVIGSTEPVIGIEICSKCHPFYTGKQKLVDTARRVEKFEERTAKVAAASTGRKGKTVKIAAKTAKRVAKAKAEESEK
jgi:large subunit ribosomal protein L31